MLRAFKIKVANILRTQVEIATEPRFAAVQGELAAALGELNALREQLRALHAQAERDARKLENERDDMAETRRMVGIACARIENFIKLQREQHSSMEQSIATLLPLRTRAVENA